MPGEPLDPMYVVAIALCAGALATIVTATTLIGRDYIKDQFKDSGRNVE